MDTRTKSCRILMLPWLSHEHILPFLDLAKLLSHRNFCIHVCTTPANLSFLKQNLSEKDSISIKLVELQLQLPSLPTSDGLKEVVEVAKPSFHKILLTLRPYLVLYDFLHSWAPVVAGTQNIPAVLFLSTGAASGSYILHSKCCPSSEYPFPAIFGRKDQDELSEFNPTVNSEGLLQSIEKSTNMVLIRLSRSIEEKYTDYLAILCQKKMVPVGSLVQVPEDEQLPPRIIQWLDKMGHRSTVLVSLGSDYLSSTEEMEQISLGSLKLSRANFIRAGEKALPEEFLEEMGERAIMVEGWDLHNRILSHSSVGGFMCHCGWRSVMESVKYDVPIIALPTSLEEALNARLVEEIGAGKEAVRNKEGHLEKQELERVIAEMLQKNQTGADKFLQELRKKLKEIEEEEIDDAVEEMEKLCKKVDRLNSLDNMLVQYKS